MKKILLSLMLIISISPVNAAATDYTTEENTDFVLENFDGFKYSLNEFDEIITITYESAFINTYRTAVSPFISLLNIDEFTADKLIESDPYLGLAFSTENRNWIFAETIDIKTDDNLYNLVPGYDSFYRDTSMNNKVHEVYSYFVSNNEELDMVKDMFESDKTQVRFVGSKGWDMVVLNDDMKEDLKANYNVYVKLLEYKDLEINDIK